MTGAPSHDAHGRHRALVVGCGAPHRTSPRCYTASVRDPVAAFTLVLLFVPACGPSAAPTEPTVTTGDDPSTGATVDPSMTGATSAPGSDSATDTGATQGDSMSSSGEAPATVPMYEACGPELDACLPGLTCTPVSQIDGRSTWMCTAECMDPLRDCEAPPDGWSPVCNGFFHDLGPDPFCAIGCTAEGDCPEGMTCGIEEPPFTAPFYCYPNG